MKTEPKNEPSPSLENELRSLSKKELVERTHSLAQEERRITIKLLWHLREIERRRIPEEQSLSGIYEYCVKVLKYSNGSAYRRIQAMRALHSLPELESNLQAGVLSVATAATLQSFLQRAKKKGIKVPGIGRPNLPNRTSWSAPSTPDEKEKMTDFFKSFQGLSGRDVDLKLAEISPELATQERERFLPKGDVEVKLSVSAGTFQKWNRIREMAAHRLAFDGSHRRVVEFATDVAFDSLEREKGLKRSPKDGPLTSVPLLSTEKRTFLNRTIPAQVRRFVWKRDEGRCTYRSPDEGIRCECRYGLEIDHILPWSHGGVSNTADNLRLLCHSHHRLLTKNGFGRKQDGFSGEMTPNPDGAGPH